MNKRSPLHIFSAGWRNISSFVRKSLYGQIVAICGAVLILLGGCKTIYVPVPSSTSTTVNVKDSTVWNIKDSVRITEKSRYKDFGDLLKPLEINGNHSHMRSWVDSTRNILVGTLEEDEIKEKTRIEYRDRIEYKDSVRVEEKPVPVEVPVEVKYIPWYNQVLSAIGLISLFTALAILGIKFIKLRGKSFLNIFKNFFKRPKF